ncbi:MAG: VanZ family protein [Salinivirgaceae bacterium]|nr:VanZ family protein [Salinivirgaceae bacterium]
MINFLFSFSPLLRRLLCLFYLFVIIFLSLSPPSQFPEITLFPEADKIIHLLMYLGLGWLVMWAFFNIKLSKALRIFLLFSVPVWGVIMELMQLCMNQGRYFSWFDILANFLGASLGVLIYRWIEKSWQYNCNKN